MSSGCVLVRCDHLDDHLDDVAKTFLFLVLLPKDVTREAL